MNDLVTVELPGLPPRRALLQLPASTRGAPLLVMLHGAGATAKFAEQQSAWAGRGRKDGFAVVLPEGTPRDATAAPSFRLNPQLWNDGSGRGHVARRGVDDVGFLVALIERLIHEHGLDASRVWLTGFSNGGSLAFRLAAERPDLVAAVAPVAGHCWVEPGPLKRAVPLLHLAGGADPLNPVPGGEVETPWGHREYHPPVRRSAERWAAACGCDRVAMSTDERGIEWAEGIGCGAVSVRQGVIPGLGHVWPGGPRLLPERLVGKASRLLSGTDAILEFFRTDGRPA